MPILALLASIVLSAATAASEVPMPRAALDGVVDAAAAKGFSGVVIAGDMERTSYRRLIPLPANSPAHMDDLWRWASVTKQITAVLVMQQVEMGRILLDAPVVTYLPDFKGSTEKTATIRQLLQHTSGLPNPDDTPSGGDEMPDFYQAANAENANSAAALGYCAGEPKAQPGSGFAYNNCDYLVLGAVLEAVTKTSFAELVSKNIAQPLGIQTLKAFPSRSVDAPVTVAATLEPAINFATFGAAGGLYGSPEDLLRFDRGLMSGALLSKAATETMWTGDPALGYAALGSWSFPARLKGCNADVRLIERRGEIGGVQVRNVIAPDLGRALIVFANSPVEFGEVWQGQGLTYELLNAAFCTAAG